MSIRSIDFQILIPKAQEVQKIKHTEIENQKANAQISIQKDIENQNKSLKQVNKSDKLHESRIYKDGQRQKSKGNHRGGSNKKQSKEDKNESSKIPNGKIVSKIDIRI